MKQHITDVKDKLRAIIVPIKARRRNGNEEGTLIIADALEGGVVMRSAIVVPVER